MKSLSNNEPIKNKQKENSKSIQNNVKIESSKKTNKSKNRNNASIGLNKNSKNNDNEYNSISSVESNFSSDISEILKDVWVSKSLKSIESIKNSSKNQDNSLISSDHHNNSLNESSSSQNDGNKVKKVKKVSQKNTNAADKTSHYQFIVNIELDSSSKSDNISADGESVHVSSNRNQNIISINDDTKTNNDNQINNNDEIKYDNNANNNIKDKNISNDDIIITNNVISKDYKPSAKHHQIDLNLEMEEFVIFDIEKRGNLIPYMGPNSNSKKLKSSRKGRKLRRRSKSPKKSPKKKAKSKKNASGKDDKTNLKKLALLKEKRIESEIGQLELPSSSAAEHQEGSEMSDIGLEVEQMRQRKVARFKKSKDSTFSITVDDDSNDGGYLFNVDQGSSDVQGDMLHKFHKNMKLLSSATASEEEPALDKYVSKRGIVLYMLSASDSEDQAAPREVNESASLTIDPLSESSSAFQSSPKTTKNKSKKEFENKSESDKNNSVLEFEKLSSNSSLHGNLSENLVASLTIVQARGLPLLNVPRKDPYCVFSVKGSKSRSSKKTKVVRDTFSPIWNSKFRFHVRNSEEKTLVFTVRYEDKFGGDTDIAVGELPLREATVGTFFEKWIPLDLIQTNASPMKSDGFVNSSCELFVTLVLEQKEAATPATSPRSTLFLSSSTATPTATATPTRDVDVFANEPYNGEISMTVTVIEAKEINTSFSLVKNAFYCAVNVLGRRDVRKTKTVRNSDSPIWDKQFLFTLGNQRDVIVFHIRNEDRISGDFTVAKAILHVDEIPLNKFVDMSIPLRQTKEVKRQPIRNISKMSCNEDSSEESVVDDFFSDESLEMKDVLVDGDGEGESAGEIHFNIVLEPRIRDVPVSPRPSPSPAQIVANVFADSKYPASPMFYYSQKQSTNEE